MFEAWDEIGGEQEQDVEPDRVSFEDSDRFEEDSVCSYLSEAESLCNNWRGWRKCGPGNGQEPNPHVLKASVFSLSDGQVPTLMELAARQVASCYPFELVDQHNPPVPEQLQKRIAFWSFPENEEDIRLYSCLANGNAEEFQKGEHLFRAKLVQDLLQIGLHLSASVVPPHANVINGTTSAVFNVAVTFDRHKITSCSCTCRNGTTTTCAHVVAVCLHRIHQPSSVTLRAPLSESLSRLERNQLWKFAQYFIHELPRQVLPTAQRLLDELLNPNSAMNKMHGAPDPTAESATTEDGCWCLDETVLHENIRNLLVKFCIPSPMVCSDVNYLSASAPPAAAEWTSLLRPLRGREPEGMWNLLSIIREMFRRSDNNAVPLLTIVTDECLACEQVIVWWYSTKVSHGFGVSCGFGRIGNGTALTAPQHASASLMDEIATLWRLAALNPANSDQERMEFKTKLEEYHMKCLERVRKSKSQNQNGQNLLATNGTLRQADFSGMKPAVEACFLDWSDYPIVGVTFNRNSPSKQLRARSAGTKANHNEPTSPPQQCPQIQGAHFVCLQPHSPQPPGSEAVVSDASSSGSPEVLNRTNSKLDSGNDSQDEDSRNVAGPSKITEKVPTVRSLEKPTDKLEICFMRAEALHAHGYYKDACDLAVTLAEEILKCSPNFTDMELQLASDDNAANHKLKKRVAHQITQRASALITKLIFLVNVLSENVRHHHLAFRVGTYGLEMFRPPASSKSLEVKMSHQEVELVTLLKKIPLGPEEYNVIRQKARALRDGDLNSRGDALLPLNLASFVFDALCCSTNGAPRRNSRDAGDEELGFNAAVMALGLKSNVSEADHPLVCEGTRRQRGELACALLVSYKDDAVKLAKIMDQLLDKDIHKMSHGMPKNTPYSSRMLGSSTSQSSPPLCARVQLPTQLNKPADRATPIQVPLAELRISTGPKDDVKAPEPKAADSEDSSAFEEDNKDWESKLRCTVFKPKHRKHGEGFGSIDSSAPETTSSDNSPTLIRRNPRLKQTGHGSDSGSSGDSSTGSRRSSLKREDDAVVPDPLVVAKPAVAALDALARSSTPCMKNNRAKAKRSPTEPNQPSEALAHFMFELAKNVLVKAGGTVTTLFNPAWGQPNNGTHRALHMSAFQIGLYALGIHNCVSQNWQSRTYSSHVSWITGQAIEIGVSAVTFLIDTWEGHMTPPEIALLSDKASRSADLHMVRAAAELAQSALPHSHALNPHEIQRALLQCKEQSSTMLEQALLAVEAAAKGGGVYPEALYDVARKWYDMYAEAMGEAVVNISDIQERVIFSNNQPDPQNILPLSYAQHLSHHNLYQQQSHHQHHYFMQEQHALHHHSFINPNAVYHSLVLSGIPTLPLPHPIVRLPIQQQHGQFHSVHPGIPPYVFQYIDNAYRVGMLAMDTLEKRVNDDRWQIRCSKKPPYGDFVKWLLGISKKLGYGYVQQFCGASWRTVASPYVLWEIAVDAAQYLANTNNVNQVAINLRSQLCYPLVQKSLTMFASCLHQKIHHISMSEYDDFVATISDAQAVYHSMPNGPAQFQQLLSELHRNKSFKRDLWEKVMGTLKTGNS